MSSKNQIIQQVHYARMRVISKPPDQTRQAARDVGPVIKGDGNTTYLCGDCETTVLETVEYKLVRDLVVKCKGAAALMISRLSHHGHLRSFTFNCVI
jgi:hypothetical protein